MFDFLNLKSGLVFGIIFAFVAVATYTKIIHMQLEKQKLENEDLKNSLINVKEELENRLNIKEKELEALKKVQENREKVLNAKKKVEVEKAKRGELSGDKQNEFYITTSF